MRRAYMKRWDIFVWTCHVVPHLTTKKKEKKSNNRDYKDSLPWYWRCDWQNIFLGQLRREHSHAHDFSDIDTNNTTIETWVSELYERDHMRLIWGLCENHLQAKHCVPICDCRHLLVASCCLILHLDNFLFIDSCPLQFYIFINDIY